MDSYENILAVGGKTNSLGRASEVIDDIYAHPARLEELFNCITAKDAWVRMRAVDSFEKIIRDKPKWIRPYIDKIFDDLALSDQPSIQWHLAQIFSEVELTDQQQARAIEWLKDRIKNTQVDWIVSVNAMKALVYFYQKGCIDAAALKALCKVQEEHASKSVRKKAASFRQAIETGSISQR